MFILEVCGGMPDAIINIISKIIKIIKIVVPIGIVVFGMIDFVKATMSQKDDEISKGQKVFIKRLLSGVLTFFVIAIVQLVLHVVDTNGTNEALACLNSILNGTGGTSYNGGTGGGSDKTTSTTVPACRYRGVSSCNTDGKCTYCGNVQKCVQAGTDCNSLVTTSSSTYQVACEKYEKLYGIKSSIYKHCFDCNVYKKFTGDKLDSCVRAGGIEGVNTECNNQYKGNDKAINGCINNGGVAEYKKIVNKAIAACEELYDYKDEEAVEDYFGDDDERPIEEKVEEMKLKQTKCIDDIN